jgi:5'-3' exoribonuclease 1
MDFKLTLGTPFLPFQQLLSVLPSASRKSIPVAYHDLMISPDSKIKDFYPTDFQTDLNGKKQEWEAVVLIPFMEEKRLLEAMKACNEKLSAYEKERNSHGPMFQYEYDSVGQGRIEGVANFPSISNALCKMTEVSRDDVFVPENKIIFGPTKKGASVLYYPGFPTMKHLKYRAELRMKQVKVFDQPSRNDNMIIKVTEESNLSTNQSKPEFLKSEAAVLIDQTVHIHWPHLVEAKVVEIFDSTQKITAKGVENVNGREFQQAVGSVRDQCVCRAVR